MPMMDSEREVVRLFKENRKKDNVIRGLRIIVYALIAVTLAFIALAAILGAIVARAGAL